MNSRKKTMHTTQEKSRQRITDADVPKKNFKNQR